MREIVLQVWCDICEKSVVEDEATNLQITSDRGYTCETDLCPGCMGGFLMNTRTVKTARKKGGEHPCDQCDFIAKTLGGLGLHKNKKHQS